MKKNYIPLGYSVKNKITKEVCEVWESLYGCRWSEPGDKLLKRKGGWSFFKNSIHKVYSYAEWEEIP